MKEKSKKGKPYFRVTKRKYKRTGLDVWLEHFMKLNIPAALVYDKTQVKPWSVWRVGKEVLGEGTNHRNANAEELKGEVVKPFCGWDFKPEEVRDENH